MNKARITPLRAVVLPVKENIIKEPIIEPKVVEVQPSSKVGRRWSILKKNIRKEKPRKGRFEQLFDHFTKYGLNKSFREHHYSIQCLLECQQEEEHQNSGRIRRKNFQRQSVVQFERNKLLINYFVKLSKIEVESEKVVNYGYLETLFSSGVDVNAVDTHGQSVLHEVARTWHVDVAKFLFTHGALLNHPDDYGRTPLHVACAVDYPQMVEFLIENGSDIHFSTYGEEQTPIHYAAKNDAGNALKILLLHGANMNDTDYKKRTPLQLAAELDRSETASILIEEGAPAGVFDESMMAAVVLMIQKMPHVATKALDQFYLTNKGSRKQFFYLNFLNPPTEGKTCFAKSPLEVAVQCAQFNLLLHPAFIRLIEVKWNKHGKWGAYLYGVANLILSLVWTIRLCSIPPFPNPMYEGNEGILGKFWEILAVSSLLICLLSEAREFYKSKKYNDQHKEWREKQLERDLQYAHPRWPEERIYLEREIGIIQNEKPPYIRDKWNYFDWITYFFMIVTIISQICNIYVNTKVSDDTMRALGSAALICLWLRMLKYSRPFKTLGPFVAILSHVVTDTLKISHLALHIFIPFIAAFWVTFGVHGVEGYTIKNGELFYNIFQMAVVGDYDFEKLDSKNAIMSRLLCFAYIFLGSIVCLNLFIALMSNTFQRVYDNVRANAIMQRASAIVELEYDMNTTTLRKHREWINKNCSPEVMYYDDDANDGGESELKRMTFQIKSKIDKVEEYLHDKFGKIIDEDIFDDAENRDQNEKSFHYDLHKRKEKNARSSNEKVTQIDDLRKELQQWRTEYRRSIVQTRAEIAGLGLMFKELLEQNENKKIKRENKRKMKWFSSMRKSMNDSSANTSTTIIENDLFERSSHGNIKFPQNGNITVELPLENETTEALLNSTTEDAETSPVAGQHPIMTGRMSNLCSDDANNIASDKKIPTNNDYFEGYTFNQYEPIDNDNRLIKSTWQSIFSKLVQHSNEVNEELQMTNYKEGVQRKKESVSVSHSKLSTIESSGDEPEVTKRL